MGNSLLHIMKAYKFFTEPFSAMNRDFEISKIRELIAYDKNEEAINRLREILGVENQELLQLSGRLQGIKSRQISGLLVEPYEINQIRYALIELLNSIGQKIKIWLKILIQQGIGKGLEYSVFYPSITIGRGMNNNVHLRDVKVSNLHGQIEVRKNGIFYVHISKTNNTTIKRLGIEVNLSFQNTNTVEISDNDIIQVGDIQLLVLLFDEAIPDPIEPTVS